MSVGQLCALTVTTVMYVKLYVSNAQGKEIRMFGTYLELAQHFLDLAVKEQASETGPVKVAVVEWSVYDVVFLMSEMEVTTDDATTWEIATQALQLVEDKHDCNLGITWDTLREAINTTIRNRKEGETNEQ